MGGAAPVGTDVAVEWERLIHPDDWPAHLAHGERLRLGEPSEVTYRLRGYDGVTRWIHARTRPSAVGGRLFVDGIVSDVTVRVEAERALAAAQADLHTQMELNAHQAFHDALTGLANRRKLFADLDTRSGVGDCVTLVLCDLNGFKAYNDSFGHPAGDALLVRLARNLEQTVAGKGHAYRLGGDEFCLLLQARLSDHLSKLIEAALSEQGEGFDVTAARGEAVIPDEADTLEAALSLADGRLYDRKRSGRTSTSRQVADVLAGTLSERDPQLGTHLQDVAQLASLVGVQVGMRPAEVEELRQAAQLHDLGKMAIPDRILDKAGALDPAEWDFIRQHPVIGERIILRAPSLRAAASTVRASHEYFDGNGYPDGLAGTAIPLAARIVAVCDAFAAMIGTRPYRSKLSASDALAELARCAGTQFDPGIVAVFGQILREHTLHELLAA